MNGWLRRSKEDSDAAFDRLHDTYAPWVTNAMMELEGFWSVHL